ncbi:MAG: ribonuclease H family protein [Lachnospiraceae bacterium]|nr:ribonuclease H family protein [Lachnospiraceae bacterium]
MTKKYYAVKVGKTPGIYETWEECKNNVDGFSGALYKSFKTLNEANDYMGYEIVPEENNDDAKEDLSTFEIILDKPYAFVDGSYNVATCTYGYGGFLIADGQKYILSGSGNDPEMASMRNVAGEVLGSQAAMEKAIELGLEELTIYYDYAGIEMWALGGWKRNKTGTIAYYDYVNNIRHKIALYFVKVKGHSGIDGNEEADRLAKKAVGIE